MAKKVTHEEIENEINRRGYTLISKYSMAKLPLKVICPNGHKWIVKIGNFRRYDCPSCNDNFQPQYTYDFVLNYFKKLNCQLLSSPSEYVNCKGKIKYLCHCGRESYTTFDSFINGNHKGCINCKNNRSGETRVVKYDEVKSYIEKDGNLLITSKSEFFNSYTLVLVKCSCGEIFKTNYSRYKIRLHKTCPKCAIKKANENSRISFDTIKKIIESDGNKLINYKYRKYHLVTFKCKCGQLETLPFTHYQVKVHKNCVKCSRRILEDKLRKYTIEDVRSIFNKNGCILLSNEYKSVDYKLNYICSCGNESATSLYHFMNGTRCKGCGVTKSSGENHWNWKGGFTSTSAYLRGCISEWKQKTIENCENKCIVSGKNFEEVHHLYSFNTIFDEVVSLIDFDLKQNINEYSANQLITLRNIVIKLHIKYGYGICLTSEIHEHFHNIYGYGDNTYDQFSEFIDIYYPEAIERFRNLNIFPLFQYDHVI